MSDPIGQEWRPNKPERRGTGRRVYDGDLGERMSGIEQRLTGVESRLEGVDHTLEKTDQAIVRLHERIDDLTKGFTRFTESAHTKIGEVIDDVERRLNIHTADEEKMLALKFDLVAEKLDRIADEGVARGSEAQKRQDILVKVLMGAGGLMVPVLGYFGAKLFDNLPKIILLMDKLEALK